jgi:hypothetical protein
MQMSRGERWARYVSRNAGTRRHWIFLAFSVVWLVLFLAAEHRTTHAVFSLGWLLLALISYERSQFSAVIRRQDEELERLRDTLAGLARRQ